MSTTLAFPVFSEAALELLRSAGEVLHPQAGELLWDAGDPYDLNLVLTGGVLLLDRRDDRVVFVVEKGDFVGELGMLMGQRAFLPGVAMEGSTVLRVRVEEPGRLVEISGSSATSCCPRSMPGGVAERIGEGGLVLAGDDDRDLHRLRSSPSATRSRTGRCCAPIRRRGQSWRRPVRCPRRARPW